MTQRMISVAPMTGTCLMPCSENSCDASVTECVSLSEGQVRGCMPWGMEEQ
jgi:hypothetical protein